LVKGFFKKHIGYPQPLEIMSISSSNHDSFSDIFKAMEDELPIEEYDDGAAVDEIFPTTTRNTPPEPQPREEGLRQRKPVTDPEPDFGSIFSAAKDMKIDEMMSSLLRAMQPEKPTPRSKTPEPRLALHHLGLVIKRLFLFFMRLLGWVISKGETWIPMHSVMMEFHRRSVSEIKDGLWDETFNGPDEYLEEKLPSFGFDVVDSFFHCLYWCIQHNRLTIPLFTFLMGYVMN